MGIFKRKPTTESVIAEFEAAGATNAEATQLVEILSAQLSPKEIRAWVADPEKANPVPDPDTVEEWGFAMHWTGINAIAKGKTHLVIAEAERFAAGNGTPHPTFDLPAPFDTSLGS